MVAWYTPYMHKDGVLIFFGLIIAIALGGLLMNYSAMHEPEQIQVQPAAVPFSVLTEGEHSGSVTERVNYRIRTEPEFEKLWGMLHEDDGMPMPTVDFDAHDVLAVFDGERSSGGYDISVVSIEETPEGTLAVTILHEEPGASCLTTSIITNPFELVVVPKSEAPLVAKDLTNIQECE